MLQMQQQQPHQQYQAQHQNPQEQTQHGGSASSCTRSTSRRSAIPIATENPIYDPQKVIRYQHLFNRMPSQRYLENPEAVPRVEPPLRMSSLVGVLSDAVSQSLLEYQSGLQLGAGLMPPGAAGYYMPNMVPNSIGVGPAYYSAAGWGVPGGVPMQVQPGGNFAGE